MRFLIQGELFNQPFLALVFFSVKKDAIFSLGICYGRELSEGARDSGALKVYVVLSLAQLFAWAGRESRAGARERRCKRPLPVCPASLGHKSSELIPISLRQGCCPQHSATQADVADLQTAQRWVRFRLRFKAANRNGNFTIKEDNRFTKEGLQLICVGVG